MGESKIEWTNATWNPVRGCSLVSAGCTNCYAMRQAHRQKNGAYKGLTRLGANGPVWTGDVRVVPEMMDYPLRLRKPHMIFVNSMSDLFHEKLEFGHIFRVFLTMQVCPRHVFQVLTKRPARMQEFIAWMEIWGEATALAMGVPEYYSWPYPNVWLGVSVENQETADERIPLLMETPAAVRWISAEPLLGLIDLESVPTLEGSIDWVVVGGESGAGARPMHPDWARSLRDQCVAAGVPYFFKQWGEWSPFATEAHYAKDSTWPGNDEVVGGNCGGLPGYGAPFKHKDDRVFANVSRHEDKPRFIEVLDRPDHTWGKENKLQMTYLRVGKKAAGRLLDGREWKEYPANQGVGV